MAPFPSPAISSGNFPARSFSSTTTCAETRCSRPIGRAWQCRGRVCSSASLWPDPILRNNGERIHADSVALRTQGPVLTSFATGAPLAGRIELEPARRMVCMPHIGFRMPLAISFLGMLLLALSSGAIADPLQIFTWREDTAKELPGSVALVWARINRGDAPDAPGADAESARPAKSV